MATLYFLTKIEFFYLNNKILFSWSIHFTMQSPRTPKKRPSQTPPSAPRGKRSRGDESPPRTPSPSGRGEKRPRDESPRTPSPTRNGTPTAPSAPTRRPRLNTSFGSCSCNLSSAFEEAARLQEEARLLEEARQLEDARQLGEAEEFHADQDGEEQEVPDSSTAPPPSPVLTVAWFWGDEYEADEADEAVEDDEADEAVEADEADEANVPGYYF